MARVRTKEWALGDGIEAGWNVKHKKVVWDEDVYLIGAMFSACSAGQEVSVRFAKGITDPSTDVLCDDCYFMLASHQGPRSLAGGGGSSEGKIMLPHGYFFPINKDEPVFMDVFAGAKGNGGHAILYYVLKREWNK